MKIFAPSKLASSNFNNSFMEEALKQAQIAFNKNEVPVGAILVDRISHKVIVRTHNMVEQARNSLLHAEIVAINQACQLLSSKNLSQKNLSQYDMYVTLEPCTMCAAAIALARIGRLFYAATDSQRGGIETRGRFFNSKACFHHPEIYSGFSADISQKLIQEFFQKIRLKVE